MVLARRFYSLLTVFFYGLLLKHLGSFANGDDCVAISDPDYDYEVNAEPDATPSDVCMYFLI